jgi:hypothetical protein
MIAELKPREQKAYVRGKMQDVGTDNNTSIVLSSDTEMEEGEEGEEQMIEIKKEKEGSEEKEVEEQLFGTPTFSRKSSTGSSSVSKTEPGNLVKS